MKKLLILGTLLLAPLATPAKNANELKATCSSEKPQDSLLCIEYIEGVLDATLAFPTQYRTVVSLTHEYQLKTFVRAFWEYMREHPEGGNSNASVALLAAWFDRKLIEATLPERKRE